jgi:hypothetical protein
LGRKSQKYAQALVVDMASTELRNFIKKHKKGLAAAALLGGIIASHFDKDPTNGATTKYTGTKITQACELSGTSHDITDVTMNGKVYIHNEKRKADFVVNIGTILPSNWHILLDSQTVYMWQGEYLRDKFPLKKDSKQEVFTDQKIEFARGLFTNSKVQLQLKCKDWVPDDSVFKLPTDSSFRNVAGPHVPEQRAIVFCLTSPESCSS